MNDSVTFLISFGRRLYTLLRVNSARENTLTDGATNCKTIPALQKKAHDYTPSQRCYMLMSLGNSFSAGDLLNWIIFHSSRNWRHIMSKKLRNLCLRFPNLIMSFGYPRQKVLFLASGLIRRSGFKLCHR